MWSLIVFPPGAALSRSMSTMVTPLSTTVTRLPFIVIVSWFHSPTGRSAVAVAAEMP